ncbi:MAG: adenine phosphoribosyltransferase [Clostridia bacterium]|nr:adenine phosphoribosyltransferase [Clostridia bacterium]
MTDVGRWVRLIRTIPDYPAPGVLFRDLTPVWADPEAFCQAQAGLAERSFAFEFDAVAAIEARGFIFAAPLALARRVPFVPLRRPGKLPSETWRVDYRLEYGEASLEMHQDAIRPGTRVLIVDDILATGGTSLAAGELVAKAGGRVAGYLFLAELAGLGGRERLKGRRVESLVTLG